MIYHRIFIEKRQIFMHYVRALAPAPLQFSWSLSGRSAAAPVKLQHVHKFMKMVNK